MLSGANLTRAPMRRSFFASRLGCRCESKPQLTLERANDALADLRAGLLQGAAVLVP